MLIKCGYEIAIAVPKATPVICLLDIHPDRRNDIQSETPFQCFPDIPSATYIDTFGNRCRRLMAPGGDITMRLEGIIYDDGLPDPIVPDAREVPVEELPPEALVFLLGSRYCETDHLSQTAWNMFGGITPGWTRAQAVCDFVHNQITFNY